MSFTFISKASNSVSPADLSRYDVLIYILIKYTFRYLMSFGMRIGKRKQNMSNFSPMRGPTNIFKVEEMLRLTRKDGIRMGITSI